MTPGERWARDELRVLRAARFLPPAWVRFLAASFQRARQTRRERRRLARQAHTWCAVGLAAGVPACVAARRAQLPAPHPLRWTLWWGATSLMLDWHLGMIEGPNGEHRDRLSAADAVSLGRVAIVPFLSARAQPPGWPEAWFAGLVLASGLADLLDGRLARRLGPTRLGRDLDATADVFAGVAATHTAYRTGWLGPTAATLGALRRVAPLTVVAIAYFATGKRLALGRPGRPFGPLAIAGLAISPRAHRTGGLLISAASVGTLLRAAAQMSRVCAQ